MRSNAIATRNGQTALASAAPGTDAWGVMWEQAAALVKSGFLPASIKTPEQAIAVILTGDELGIPKMLALRSIHVIEGRPTLSADLMASLVQREIDRHRDGYLMVLPPTAEACTVLYRRWGWPEGQEYTYTMADAQRANLAARATWKAHPAAMLRARATAAVCRMAFADVIAGLYAPEELDDEPGFAVVAEMEPVDRSFMTPAAPEPAEATEPIDVATGEILASEPEPISTIQAEIRGAARQLGWTMASVHAEAVKLGLNMRRRDGATAMRDVLITAVADALGETPAQDAREGRPIDAAYAVAGEAGRDHWTER